MKVYAVFCMYRDGDSYLSERLVGLAEDEVGARALIAPWIAAGAWRASLVGQSVRVGTRAAEYAHEIDAAEQFLIETIEVTSRQG